MSRQCRWGCQVLVLSIHFISQKATPAVTRSFQSVVRRSFVKLVYRCLIWAVRSVVLPLIVKVRNRKI